MSQYFAIYWGKLLEVYFELLKELINTLQGFSETVDFEPSALFDSFCFVIYLPQNLLLRR